MLYSCFFFFFFSLLTPTLFQSYLLFPIFFCIHFSGGHGRTLMSVQGPQCCNSHTRLPSPGMSLALFLRDLMYAYYTAGQGPSVEPTSQIRSVNRRLGSLREQFFCKYHSTDSWFFNSSVRMLASCLDVLPTFWCDYSWMSSHTSCVSFLASLLMRVTPVLTLGQHIAAHTALSGLLFYACFAKTLSGQ